MTCVKFQLQNVMPAASWLNDMECEFIVLVLKVPEYVFHNNKFHSDWMKIIIVYMHNWKQ
jgi:hypothetical protein